MRRIDLHAHTWHSDGSHSPTELVDLAREAGLCALAVTDHDTTQGLAEARLAGERLGIEIIDGCEISTSIPSSSVHVLSYGFDLDHAEFQGLLAQVRSDRDTRNLAILERLAGLGVALTLEQVQAEAIGTIIARPHFAAALVKNGHVDTVREAFDRYLRDGGPAYVAGKMPDPAQAIQAVVRAGGVAVIAHPRQLKLEAQRAYRTVIGRFVDAGLAGLEVDHPSHDATHRHMFREMAVEFGLVSTGGSDFHGRAKPHIKLGAGDGTIEVGYETWEQLRARARSATS